MAGTSIEKILGANNLVGLIQAKTEGLPADILPPGFLPGVGNIRPCEGDRGTYTVVYGNRQVARQVQFGSPALKRSLAGIRDVDVRLIHTFEEVQIKPTDVQNLLNENNPTKQTLGAQTVARQIADFRSLFTNLRIAALYSALFKGNIWFGAGGLLQGTSSSAAITVNMQIPATHQNQLNSIIGASWATAGTDILGDLVAIKQAALRDYGAPLRYAFYGAAIPGYIAGNTALKQMISGDPGMSAAVARGELPDVGGLKWIPGYQAYFQNSAGTDTSLCADDAVVFTPEPSPEWLEWLEGTYPIPTNLTLSGDAAAALASLQETQGMFSYANVSLNPPGVTMYCGDTFLPVIKAVNAIFIADVVP